MSGARLVALALLAGLLGACGGGTAALIGGDGGNSGPASPSVGGLTLGSAKTSPAQIGFTVTRAGEVKSLTLEVELPAVAPEDESGSDPTVLPIASLAADELAQLAQPDGSYRYAWFFDADLPGGAAHQPDLVLHARLGNGKTAPPLTAVVVGNDPPVILDVQVPGPGVEVVGLVGLPIVVADTGELVDVHVEVNVDEAGGFPAAAWTDARPFNLPAGAPIPVPNLPGVEAVPAGTERSFFWDVVGQFGALDSGVRVRVTAADRDEGGQPLASAAPVVTATFRVDNNEPPFPSLDDAAFVLSEDRLFGIAVPYTVSDAEGDPLDLVFQWTREGESFVDLPDDEAQVAAILADPALREAYRVATPYLSPVAGLTRPAGASDRIELPELGSTQAHLLNAAQTSGDLGRTLDGLELELLRPSKVPGALAATWSAGNPLDGPVAALPVGDGTTARVLDRAGPSAWRVREVDLATGAALAELATGSGEPDTMVAERGGAALLVGSHDGSLLRVHRVDLDTLEVRALAERTAATPGDTFRGLASLGSTALLATLGDELLRLDYADPLVTTVATVLDGLATPWGLVRDPVTSRPVYLAERDVAGVGRVVSVALDSLAVDPLPAAPPGLPHPEALALERGGRLLVLTDEIPSDGTKELRALEPGSTLVTVVRADLPESTVALATGPAGLRLLAPGSGGDLAAGGGVEQVRTIVDYDAPGREVTVAPPFDPVPSGARPWRVRSPRTLTPAAGIPRSGAFVWDSRDLWGGGRGLLRLTARDADPNVVEHAVAKTLRSPLEGLPLTLATTESPVSVAVADLDGDGDEDLVSANADTLTVFLARSPGVFPSSPSATLGGPGITKGPRSVAAADLDGDGAVDLVSANVGSDTLTVFLASAPGVSPASPSFTLGEPGTTDFPSSVAAADVDGDGDLDLVSSNGGSHTLTIFYNAHTP